MWDPERKNLYSTADGDRDGLARIDPDGEELLLSGSHGANIADAVAFDSRGNAYWLSRGIDHIDVAGDALSEVRRDLKGRT